MIATRLATLLVFCGLLAACGVPADTLTDNNPSPDKGQAGSAPIAEIEPIHELPPPTDHVATDGERQSEGPVVLNPDPEATSRNLRRMTIDQLQEAISVVTGGLSWRVNNRDEFERLKPTLGVPNYLDTTNEDLEASLVFQKFLGDGVRSVCSEAIDNDLDMDAADRVMIRFVEPGLAWDDADEAGRAAIDQNLRYMKLRITGHHVAPDDEAGLARLRWLLRSVTHATGDANRGWRAVCVGLMSSPEFYLY